MNDAKSLLRAPWDFRMRGIVFGILYALGFFIGFNLQFNLYGSATPSYVLIGQRWGTSGIHAAAFIPVLLTLIALAIRVWGTAYLSSGIVWSEDVKTGSLRVSGPYRYVRNPLYLSNIFAAVGVGLLGPPIVTLLIIVGITGFCVRLIMVEERFLAATQTTAYKEYCALVPRLIPRLTPAPIESDSKSPAWFDAFWAELFSLIIALYTIYNAVSTWQRPGVWALVILFIVIFALRLIWRRFVVPEAPASS